MSKEAPDLTRSIADALHASGLRCTPQRYAVFDYLVRGRVHATAEEIVAAINRSDPRASRATVYNSLHALMNAGLVREVGGGPAARYDAGLDRHHHFECEGCGSLEDIPWFEIPISARSQALGSRRVHRYEIVFRGLCQGCQKSGEPK